MTLTLHGHLIQNFFRLFPVLASPVINFKACEGGDGGVVLGDGVPLLPGWAGAAPPGWVLIQPPGGRRAVFT